MAWIGLTKRLVIGSNNPKAYISITLSPVFVPEHCSP